MSTLQMALPQINVPRDEMAKGIKFEGSGPVRIILPASMSPGTTLVVSGGQVLTNTLHLSHPVDRRCQALTNRGTRCRLPVSSIVCVAGQRGQHSACKIHTRYIPGRGWV